MSGSQPEDATKDLAHMEQEEHTRHGCTVRKVSVRTVAAAKCPGKGPGDRFIVETGPLYRLPSARDAGNCLSEVLETVFAPLFQKRLCICGLGNPDNICDSLGPAVIRLIPAMFLEQVDTCGEGRFSKLAVFAPNVQDATNLKTEVLVAGMAAAAEADGLVLIDAIATGSQQHLCNHIQISTAGGSFRHAGGRPVDWSVLGLPVISIGVPTLFQDHSCMEDTDSFLTAYRIQEAVSAAAALIAYALIRVSYPSLSEGNCIEAVRLRQDFPLDW